LTDKFGWAEGNIKLGSGLVWQEVQKIASENQRMVVTGWSATVGVIGWSIGGGHGPLAPSRGLGVDNILEIELVNAKGELIVCNKEKYSDLFKALRGGGGSTWGVITSITVRLHKIPDGGLVLAQAAWTGNYCDSKKLNSTIDGYLEWTLTLKSVWGGLAFLLPTIS
jgi:ribonuclease T2